MILIFLGFGFLIGMPLAFVGLYHDNKQAQQQAQQIEEDTRYELEERLTLLESIIERRKRSAYILELELRDAAPNKKASLLNKLNTLDKQTYKDMQELNKLKELL